MKLTIDRTKWYRGRLSQYSRLLLDVDFVLDNGVDRDDQGKMCCLGFYSLACGLEPRDIAGVEYPDNLDDLPPVMEWLVENDEDAEVLGRVIAAVNDDPALTDSQREALLTKEFADHGVEVTFIN